MSNTNETMMEMKNFVLPQMADGDFSMEELAEESSGLRLSFPRVKIPGGGVLQFELPGDDPEDPEYVKTLEGVILYNHATGAYWPEGEEYDDDTQPLCSSVDGICGIGEPGGDCATCEMNQWGTASNGVGKACKNMRVLYLLRDGEFIPIQLTLPPTSINPFNKFYNLSFYNRRRATYGSVVQIGLKREDNGKDEYSVATFKKLFDFTGEQLAQIKAYALPFKEQIKALQKQRMAAAMSQSGGFDSYGPNFAAMPDGDLDESFDVASPGADIDGDREDLPV